MVSKAQEAFDNNAKDIQRLIDLHQQEGGEARGRRYGLEVLNKSAVVLITAFWEAYCEDIASEGLEHIVNHARSSDALPAELKKQIANKVKKSPHDLEVWKLSDDGWRIYLRAHLEEMKEERDRKLNTPKTKQINDLFKVAIGIDNISKSWSWARKMTAERASKKLDKYVTLRGSIAHRGADNNTVKKADVVDYFEFTKLLVSKTGGKVNSHVKTITGKPLWE